MNTETNGHVTIDDLPKLKGYYNLAVEKGWEQFDFNGSILLTAYAKYLIEYLEGIKARYGQL